MSLKREAFSWSDDAEHVFLAFKRAFMMAPILQPLDFTHRFFVDCDASGTGFDAVLHQGDGTVAYVSQVVAAHHAKLLAYERELVGLVKAIHQWRPYLWVRSFTVRTEHFSLKYILDHRLSTIPQHTWVRKLFGYNLNVEYRPGKQNTVADTLTSRHGGYGVVGTVGNHVRAVRRPS